MVLDGTIFHFITRNCGIGIKPLFFSRLMYDVYHRAGKTGRHTNFDTVILQFFRGFYFCRKMTTKHIKRATKSPTASENDTRV